MRFMKFMMLVLWMVMIFTIISQYSTLLNASADVVIRNNTYTLDFDLDFESYASVNYIRYTVYNPNRLVYVKGESTNILFALQLPSAWSNLEGDGPLCTTSLAASASTTLSNVTEIFNYTELATETRGYEIDFPSTAVFGSDPLYCVIRLRANPAVTSKKSTTFDIVVLDPHANIWNETTQGYTSSATMSFYVPTAVPSSSARIFPDDYPFLYSTDVYTTTFDISSRLLALRPNNRLILVHPWSFTIDTDSTFCTSAHDIELYNYAAQAPVSEFASTGDSIAISLSPYSSTSDSISCQISLQLTDVEAQDASTIAMYLEYQYYNSTGTTTPSNYFYTFTQRSFSTFPATYAFPSYSSSTMLAVPAIATAASVAISPVFIRTDISTDGFWNRFIIDLSYFTFETDELLFLPFPPELIANNTCVTRLLARDISPIQFDNCIQELGSASCADFDAHVVADAGHTSKLHGAYGITLQPLTSLRLSSATCTYDFAWSINNLSDVGGPDYLIEGGYQANAYLIPSSYVTSLTSTSLSIANSVTYSEEALNGTISSFDLELMVYYSPDISASLWDYTLENDVARANANFKTPMTGGTLNVTIEALVKPLFDQFRIEVYGLRISSLSSVYISEVIIDGTTNATASLTSSSSEYYFVVTAEELSDPTGEDTDSHLYPVITFYTSNSSGYSHDINIALTYSNIELPIDSTYLTEIETVRLYHYDSLLSEFSLGSRLTTNGEFYFVMTKSISDVSVYFGQISWLSVIFSSTTESSTSTASLDDDYTSSYYKTASYDNNEYVAKKIYLDSASRPSPFSPLATSTTTVSASSSLTDQEWYIYESGYIGIALTQFYAVVNDTIIISDTSASFVTNITSISNVLTCSGAIYNISGTTPVLQYSDVDIFVISVDEDVITAVFTQNLTLEQTAYCNVTVSPRFPVTAQEQAVIPSFQYVSSLFGTSSSDATVYNGESSSGTTYDSSDYPLTYQLPIDVSNLAEISVTLTTIDSTSIVYSPGYVALRLQIEGIDLTGGSDSTSSSITITGLSTSKFTSVSSAKLSSPITSFLTCPGTVLVTSSSSTLTISITTTDANVTSTQDDPFICEFALSVLVSSSSDVSATPTINIAGTSTQYSSNLTFATYPYTLTYAADSSTITGTLSAFSKYPILLSSLPIYQSSTSTCNTTSGVTIATVSYSAALGMALIEPLSEYTEDITSATESYTAQSCTFQFVSTLNTDSQSIMTSTGPYAMLTTTTIPAITSQTSSGINVLFDYFTLPFDSTPLPIPGVVVNIRYTTLDIGDVIQVFLPPSVAYTSEPPSDTSSFFTCSSASFTLTSAYFMANSSWVVNVTTVVGISSYDTSSCAFYVEATAPASASNYSYVVWSGTVATTTASTPEDILFDQTSTAALGLLTAGNVDIDQQSSKYSVNSSYTLQWSQAEEQLQLVLDITYSSTYFNTKSNRLSYDFSGMKSSLAAFSSNVTTTSGGIQAGSAIISETLTAAYCFVPTTDVLGNIISQQRISAQYIRETGYQLILSIPDVTAGDILNIRCRLPVFVYNQQFIITPTIQEYPTLTTFIDTDAMPPLTISTWFPSSSIVILDDATSTSNSTNSTNSSSSTLSYDDDFGYDYYDDDDDYSVQEQNENNGVDIITSISDLYTTLSKFFDPTDIEGPDDEEFYASGNAQDNKRVSSSSSKKENKNKNHYVEIDTVPTTSKVIKKTPSEAKQRELLLASSMSATSLAYTLQIKPTMAKNSRIPTELTYNSHVGKRGLRFSSAAYNARVLSEMLPSATTTYDPDEASETVSNNPQSTVDQAEDIRYLEILFKHAAYFTNDELDDIVTTIYKLTAEKDRTIKLNSIIILAQQRPPLSNSTDYMLLRIGFAGIDVESTLLESKFAGVDYIHWLSGSYDVYPYTLINSTVGDYYYGRTRVPIACLTTIASSNEITKTCGSECGRLCSEDDGEVTCETDFDCQSLNCNSDTHLCESVNTPFTSTYTGIYSNYGKDSQYSITLSEALHR